MKLVIDRPDIGYQSSPSPAQPPAEYPNGMRVSDKVLSAFNHACLMGDLDAADELVVVLESIAERRIRRFGGDRRKETFTACQAREHLDWLRTSRHR